MATVTPKDILLRCGGATLRRLQTLASAGSGRIESPHTFARANAKRAFIDRDGNIKLASPGNLAISWPSGLVDASGTAIGGPQVDSARTQLVTQPENFGAWTVNGTPVLTATQADPFGGTSAYLIEDDNAAGFEYVALTTAFSAGTLERAVSVFLRAGTATFNDLRLQDTTAPATRHRVRLTWTAGVPVMTTIAGSGTRFAIEPYPGNWYRCSFTAAGVIGTNTNRLEFSPVGFDVAGNVGTTYFFGVNAWNAPFVTGYQGAALGTATADDLTVPFNWGPTDITVLVRLARPTHADVSGALGVSPGIFSLGAGTAPRLGLYFDPAARNIISAIDTATTDVTQTTAVPAGQPVICVQYRNLTTGGSTALDVGSGLTAFSSAATAFSAFGAQTLRVGRYDDELNGVVGDIVVARGLYTRAEMLAIP